MQIAINTQGSIRSISNPDTKLLEARKRVKFFLSPAYSEELVSDSMIPDFLVTDSMLERYLAIEPPLFRIISEFDPIVEEIERAYVLGAFFSALSASVVVIERLLNMARIELHHHISPKIKGLWEKGPLNSWQENIDALVLWRYLEPQLAKELSELYEVRCNYLHSGRIDNLEADALRSIRGAYILLQALIGFPRRLFSHASGSIECFNENDPLFKVFYAPHVFSE